jgi:Na+/proline symporter
MTLFALKNILDIKLRFDVLHTLLFLISFILIVFFVGKAFIFEKDWMRFFLENPSKRGLFPSDSSTWFSMFVYLGVQWWSCYLFDGGGAETSRFTAVKTSKDATKAALTPILLSSIISFFMGIHVIALLGYVPADQGGELSYVSSLFQILPSFVTDLVFLGFFAMFITTAESLLNWGASFLVIDAWVGWFKKQSSTKISMLTMVLLSGFSIAVALNVKDLQQLIKITFSISAGVAPVFILRWVWFRINAWSQLSAMLSSGVYMLLYPWFHSRGPWSVYPMEEARIVWVTLLTSITWIGVTLLTKNQSDTIKAKMISLIHPALFIKRLTLSLMLGVLFTTLIFIGWWFILN